MKIMTFHRTETSWLYCNCKVRNKIGFDAFDNEYKVIVDDFGNIVFIRP